MTRTHASTRPRAGGRIAALGLLAALAPPAPGAGQPPDDPSRWAQTTRRLNEEIQERERLREIEWAIFLGTGHTAEDARALERLAALGRLLNPFTGRPFPGPVAVFAEGWENPILEAVRVVTQHLEIHAFRAGEGLAGYHIRFGIFHSNGSAWGVDAHRAGDIRVDNLLVLGGDRQSFPFAPGDLRGSDVYFFAIRGDPVWRLPAPAWMPIGERGAGLGYSIYFDRPADIPRAVHDLVTKGRADAGRYPVIFLEPPAGQAPALLDPFRAHAFQDSYGRVLPGWMASDDPVARELRRKFDAASPAPPMDDGRKVAPWPPGGGPGGGAPPGTGRTPGAGPGGISPAVPAPPERGGVHAEVEIEDRDFAPAGEGKKGGKR